MKKVIVTGATGFIGTNVVNELCLKGIEVIAIVRRGSRNIYKLDRYNIRIIECDLCEIQSLAEKINDRDIDTIYHFMWQGVSNKDQKNEKIQIFNIMTTLNLIDVAYKLGVKKFIGSGSIHEIEVIREMSNNKRVSDLKIMYKSSKLAAHYMGKVKAGAYGIKFLWPIIINAYGPGEESERLINTVIRKLLRGQSIDLSEGNQLYDFVHVVDVARAFRLLGEKGNDGMNYTIGSGNPKPLKEYLQTVENVISSYINSEETQLRFGHKNGNVVFLSEEDFSIESISHDTGYMPSISFEEGIEKVVAWYYKYMYGGGGYKIIKIIVLLYITFYKKEYFYV